MSYNRVEIYLSHPPSVGPSGKLEIRYLLEKVSARSRVIGKCYVPNSGENFPT